MPRLFGMEPSKWKPIALVGGGAVVLFLFLRGRNVQGAAPQLATAPPTDQGPLASAPAGGAVSGDYSFTREQAEALQLQQQRQDLDYQKAAQQLSLQVGQAQANLQTQIYKRQEDVVRSKPVSCPHGSEVRLGPDGTPYCRSSRGAVTFGNVVSEPAAQTVKELIPTAIRAYAAPYIPGGLPNQQTKRPGQTTEPGLPSI